MAQAATAFEGRHDFSAFGGADPQPVRTVHRIRLEAGRAALDGAAAPARGLCLRRVVLGRRNEESRTGMDAGHEEA